MDVDSGFVARKLGSFRNSLVAHLAEGAVADISKRFWFYSAGICVEVDCSFVDGRFAYSVERNTASESFHLIRECDDSGRGCLYVERISHTDGDDNSGELDNQVEELYCGSYVDNNYSGFFNEAFALFKNSTFPKADMLDAMCVEVDKYFNSLVHAE